MIVGKYKLICRVLAINLGYSWGSELHLVGKSLVKGLRLTVYMQ